MATLRDIKRRIKGVQNTQQITKAMKMVAAAKLRKAQEGILNARPYARQIKNLLGRLATENDYAANPYFVERPVTDVAFVIVTADRGLCGAFNTNIIKEANRYIANELLPNNLTPHLFFIGKKGFDAFKRTELKVIGNEQGIFSHLKFDTAVAISDKLISGYLENKYQKIVILYNEFKSIIQQNIIVEQFLPVPVPAENNKEKSQADYIFEPEQNEIVHYLLPKHLKAQIWRILLESNAAELGAKMTAMDNATTNAKELIRSLTIKYNKERQAAITKEILEIVSGANALKAN